MAYPGYRSSVTASAPGRVCLAGESLDWMTGDPSIVSAIPLRTNVTAYSSHRPGPIELRAGAPLWRSRSITLPELGSYVGDDLDHLQATARVLARRCGERLTGTMIESTTGLPIAAGVSSSAAVTVAASAALLLLADRSLPRQDVVAAMAYRAESIELETGAGWMDFLACTYGGVRQVFPGQRPRAVELTDRIGMPIVLIDTGQRHCTAEVLASKRDRFRSGEPGVRHYAERAPGIVSDMADALRAEHPDYPAIGALLTEAHRLLRDQVQCSTPLIEECIARILPAGAFGAKLSGSGHGGCLFALVGWDDLEPVRRALSTLPVRVTVFTSGDPHGVVFLPADHNSDEGTSHARPVQADQGIRHSRARR
ncbi:mevalonate kinase family protein [Nocardia lijiangensis]|uniref:mevalonate kinase family protein n=1 Tax=Nocardia lijiangensis TaxID=299618 RepID=UPI0008327535|nr:hypothetical protein [Nocardia lijiangensis]